LYGQFILDDINFSLLREGNGWWGNKYGFQTGLKYFGVLGLDKLDLQLETNTVRPYTYSHREPSDSFPGFSTTNYSHYGQPLAHPLGANFTEFIGKLFYEPIEKLDLTFRYVRARVGRDFSDRNFGADILKPNITRISNFNIEQHQGRVSDIAMLDLATSYELRKQLYVDLQFIWRADYVLGDKKFETLYIGGGLRYNWFLETIDY